MAFTLMLIVGAFTTIFGATIVVAPHATLPGGGAATGTFTPHLELVDQSPTPPGYGFRATNSTFTYVFGAGDFVGGVPQTVTISFKAKRDSVISPGMYLSQTHLDGMINYQSAHFLTSGPVDLRITWTDSVAPTQFLRAIANTPFLPVGESAFDNDSPTDVREVATTRSLTTTMEAEFQIQGHEAGDSFTIALPDSAEGDFTRRVPEPASLTLLAIGIAGMAGYAWRRKRQKATA
jgi:hypothetical protein